MNTARTTMLRFCMEHTVVCFYVCPLIIQTVPSRSPLPGARSIQAVQRHRRLAQRESIRSPISNNWFDTIRRNSKARENSNPPSGPSGMRWLMPSKQYPQWTGRRDRRGIPVYVYEVRHLNSKTMAAYEKSSYHTHSKANPDGKTPAKLLRLFALYENLVRFVMPMCTALTDREHSSTPITQSNNIVDISGVGLKQFWNLRAHMQDASTLATAHYPETLDRIFVRLINEALGDIF